MGLNFRTHTGGIAVHVIPDSRQQADYYD